MLDAGECGGVGDRKRVKYDVAARNLCEARGVVTTRLFLLEPVDLITSEITS